MKNVALEDKKLLNPKEAASYFGIGEVRLRKFLKQFPREPYMVYYGDRCLILREKFAQFLREHPDVFRRRRQVNDKKEKR